MRQHGRDLFIFEIILEYFDAKTQLPSDLSEVLPIRNRFTAAPTETAPPPSADPPTPVRNDERFRCGRLSLARIVGSEMVNGQAASFSRLVKGRKASVPIFDQCRSSVKVMT
jgi:hypothetical protein